MMLHLQIMSALENYEIDYSYIEEFDESQVLTARCEEQDEHRYSGTKTWKEFITQKIKQTIKQQCEDIKNAENNNTEVSVDEPYFDTQTECIIISLRGRCGVAFTVNHDDERLKIVSFTTYVVGS